jgi:hypothetical protein
MAELQQGSPFGWRTYGVNSRDDRLAHKLLIEKGVIIQLGSRSSFANSVRYKSIYSRGTVATEAQSTLSAS